MSHLYQQVRRRFLHPGSQRGGCQGGALLHQPRRTPDYREVEGLIRVELRSCTLTHAAAFLRLSVNKQSPTLD